MSSKEGKKEKEKEKKNRKFCQFLDKSFSTNSQLVIVKFYLNIHKTGDQELVKGLKFDKNKDGGPKQLQ